MMTELVLLPGASGRVWEGPGPGAGLSPSWTGDVPARTESPVSRSPVRRAGAAAGTTRSVTWSAGGRGPASGPPAPVEVHQGAGPEWSMELLLRQLSCAIKNQ